jgi:peptide deformylase
VGVLSIVTVNATTRDLPEAAVRQAARDLIPSELGSDWLTQFISDMYETLYATAGGIGLAATQVGVLLRVAVISLRDGPPPIVLINPAYQAAGEETETVEERCLSAPDFVGAVPRPTEIRATYLDHRGVPHDELVRGFMARVMQHEIDHLDGILYLDRIADKGEVRAESGGFAARQAARTMEGLLA